MPELTETPSPQKTSQSFFKSQKYASHIVRILKPFGRLIGITQNCGWGLQAERAPCVLRDYDTKGADQLLMNLFGRIVDGGTLNSSGKEGIHR